MLLLLSLLLNGGFRSVGRLLLQDLFLLLFEPLPFAVGHEAREAAPSAAETGGDVMFPEGGAEGVVELFLHLLCRH
jgi:hypothetical protein